MPASATLMVLAVRRSSLAVSAKASPCAPAVPDGEPGATPGEGGARPGRLAVSAMAAGLVGTPASGACAVPGTFSWSMFAAALAWARACPVIHLSILTSCRSTSS
eukprot:1872555-Heterocapsa_arctica.AAC.1